MPIGLFHHHHHHHLLMHITPMLLSAKSVNINSFCHSIFTTPEQSMVNEKMSTTGNV